MEDIRLKQRLVGAIVLVSLAVIFIPMILSGGDPASPAQPGTDSPARPTGDFVSRIIPLDKTAPEVAENSPAVPATVDEQQPVKIYKRPQVTAKEAETTPAAEAAPVPKQVKKTEPLKTASKETAKTATKVTTASKPDSKSVTPSKLKAGWVVQVGSFGSKNNAYGLSDKLRKKGFASFVDSISKSGKTTFRVRIGPEANKQKADDVLARAQKVTGTKGFVTRYP